ncbi:hypothetical protein DICPUDRAFT_154333 [Dictyostelium purpureum]|uniref:Uncharacterized protein n=1 Tax=Dictyostelium purpureum TaxID=5786 RepID=F0ZR26_DICPU|nr:uncharacterized protein DICPUDRAFT_154333 [Dictyostelium purpureum]EGC33599.1 hypothetical protein DICPUDRAFT_154333 [Dictyostelium purpureum]|eukprot:XP_003289867.1 hypothetical protein DICPUDRAFT_154333 [Dictyostelium purpureum]
MKSIQKIILIKILIILFVSFIILNISQLHLNNKNKINLNRRETKFFIKEETHIPLNNKNEEIKEIISNTNTINIGTNDNNKNQFINEEDSISDYIVEPSENANIITIESSTNAIENENESKQEETSQVIPSFNNIDTEVNYNIKFVPGEAPKYTNREIDC